MNSQSQKKNLKPFLKKKNQAKKMRYAKLQSTVLKISGKTRKDCIISCCYYSLFWSDESKFEICGLHHCQYVPKRSGGNSLTSQHYNPSKHTANAVKTKADKKNTQ